MLLRQEGPGPLSGQVHAASVDNGVGPRKVDKLKHAHAPLCRVAVAPVQLDALGGDNDDLPGQQVPLKHGAHRVQGAGFGSKDDLSAGPSAHAKGPEAMGIPGGDQLCGRGDDQRIGPLDPIHGGGDGSLDGAAAQPFLHDNVGNDLGIGAGVEDGALLFQLVPQLKGVGQVAVVGKSHTAFMVVDDQGLNIALVIRAGGGVAHMAHHDVALAQGGQMLRGEHLVYQTRIPESGEYAIVVKDDTCALLAPVLQGEKAVVGKGRQVRSLLGKDAKDAAFFMNVAFFGCCQITVRHGLRASS